jgi:hypothetical protein
LFNPGEIEMLDGPQRVMDWSYNARIQNVWKMIHNRYIYDPRYLNPDDVENPDAGDGIALQADAMTAIDAGVDPRRFFAQLEVRDFTSPHAELGGLMFDMMQRMSAASDPAMGAPTREQKTLGEVQSILASGSQRTGIVAKMLDEMAVKPTVIREIANRQQFTTLEQYYRIGGDMLKQNDVQRALIRRQDLYGNFDYTPITGTMPADPARMAELWRSILDTVARAPQLFLTPMGPTGRVLDVREVFNESIRHSGIKDFDRFWQDTIQPMGPPQVVPDAATAAMQPLGPGPQGIVPPLGPEAAAPPPAPGVGATPAG